VRLTDSTNATLDLTADIEVANVQDPTMGGFLTDTGFGSATCSRTGSQICCSNVLLKSKNGQQLCSTLCYEWDVASQGLITASSVCSPPQISSTPTPTPHVTPTPTPTPISGAAVCGNGVAEGDEDCDGDDLDFEDCDSIVGAFDGCIDPDKLKCDSTCHFDASQCVCPCSDDFDCNEEIDCTVFPQFPDCDFVFACVNGTCVTSMTATLDICSGSNPFDGEPRCEE